GEIPPDPFLMRALIAPSPALGESGRCPESERGSGLKRLLPRGISRAGQSAPGGHTRGLLPAATVGGPHATLGPRPGPDSAGGWHPRWPRARPAPPTRPTSARGPRWPPR